MTLAGYEEEAKVVARVMRTGRPEVLRTLRTRYPEVLAPGPIGPLLPDEAMVLPLGVVGQQVPIGALVLGVNPYRPLDDVYRAFLTLIGTQVGVALADSQAFEAQRQRVQVMADLDLVKMEFFQNVSHELRTPLTLLLSPLQDLLEPADALRDDQRENVEVAVRAAQRLRRIVDALLDFAQAEAGTLAPDRQPVDLARLTAETASMFRSTAEHAGLRLEVAVPPEPAIGQVDAGMWSTVVTNLVANAVKFTSSGVVNVQLTMTADDAVLTVADTGIGIAPEEQANVFDRFYQAPRAGSSGGAGIGLALVSDLVRAHDGNIELVSSPGWAAPSRSPSRGVRRGRSRCPPTRRSAPPAKLARRTSTRLRRVATPAAVPAPSPPGGRRLRTRPVTTPRPLRLRPTGPGCCWWRTMRTCAAISARILTEDGWAVRAVADAESAAVALDQESADAATDLVLTDVMLPGRTGLELVTELRANERTARLPIVVLTARGGTAAAAEGLAAGADDYLTKPFATPELLARVRANYELQQLRERAVDVADTRAAQLRSALDSNRVIGTATGILMATHRLPAAQGFQLLTRASQDSNRKLRDLAAQVVDNGGLPFRQTAVDNLIIRVTTPRR